MIGKRFEAPKTGLNLSAEPSRRHVCRASSLYADICRRTLVNILAFMDLR